MAMKWLRVIVPRGVKKYSIPMPSAYQDVIDEIQRKYDGVYPVENRITLWHLRWEAAEKLKEAASMYEGGSKTVLIHALSLCLEYDLSVPDWLSEAFVEAVGQIENYEKKTWVDVFGTPHASGVHLAAKRKHEKLSLTIYSDILDEIRSGKSVDESLFEQVGKKHNVGKTLAASLYYSEKKIHDDF